MAIFDIPTADTNAIFLEDIQPGLISEIITNTVVWDRFKTDTQACKGEYGIMKLQTKGAKSARPSGSTAWPTAQQGSYAEFQFYMKRGMYATLQFDNLAIACGKGIGAVKEIVAAEIEGITDYLSDKLNKQYWGDGSGRLATLNASSSNSTTVEIDFRHFGQDASNRTLAHQYLAEGMYIDIYYSTTNEVEEVAISSLTDDTDGTSTIVMASAVTATDGAEIFDHDTYAAAEAAGTGVPMGLRGIINTANPYVGNTATSAFQGINRTTAGNTYAQARTVTMGGSAVPVTDEKIMEMLHGCEKNGTTDVILCNSYIWRAYWKTLAADKTMPNDPAYWGGTTGISFYGGKKDKIAIVRDDDAPDQTMFFIDDSKIKIVSPTENNLEWVKTNGAILHEVEGKDEVVAHLKNYYNMTAKNCQALGYLTNIKHLDS